MTPKKAKKLLVIAPAKHIDDLVLSSAQAKRGVLGRPRRER
jgi:hypothetical protein